MDIHEICSRTSILQSLVGHKKNRIIENFDK